MLFAKNKQRIIFMLADLLPTSMIFLHQLQDGTIFPLRMNTFQRKFHIFGEHKAKSSLNSDTLKKWPFPYIGSALYEAQCCSFVGRPSEAKRRNGLHLRLFFNLKSSTKMSGYEKTQGSDVNLLYSKELNKIC